MSFNQLQANVLCYKNVKFSNYESFQVPNMHSLFPNLVLGIEIVLLTLERF